ncbi:hypothetical protein [Parathalassolituus penaei]|uniref:Uncharacterized protein n=1 Tax=Parathalassolituus penaei TaxID=2997323 RepID=A0A9X3ELI9_9GAMM|nr:hypothetical protein [Parathalassolituus penaei]MCY0964858.1 hypothetical protein [Parathalassolituus penaei]
MHITDLINNIAPDTQQRVEKAKNTYNRLIRDAIRFESRLSLNPGRGDSITDEMGIKIPIRLEAGYPDCLRDFFVPEEFRIAALLSEIRPQLVQVRDSSSVVGQFLADYQQEPTLEYFVGGSICHAEREAEQLLKLLDVYDLVRELLNTRQDILGLYRPTHQSLHRMNHPHWYNDEYRTTLDAGEVIIYWSVIGIIAPRLGVSIEALTCVVLAHELAHAYTQAGFDIDGQNWPLESFFGSDVYLIEGLAQYYTERLAEKLDSRIPGLQHAYKQLLEKQTGPYRHHTFWIDDLKASPEQIRHAMLKVRRPDSIPVQEFEHHLKH